MNDARELRWNSKLEKLGVKRVDILGQLYGRAPILSLIDST